MEKDGIMLHLIFIHVIKILFDIPRRWKLL